MEEKKKTSSKNKTKEVKKNNAKKKNTSNKTNNDKKLNTQKEQKVVLEEVKEEIEVKKENETKEKKENLKLEKIFCGIIALIFIVLFILCFFMQEFIPATLITLSLELFSIAYFISEKDEKNKKIYILFTIGMIILFGAIAYTLSKIM